MLALTKFLFWEENWALGCNSMKYPDFPNFLRSLVLSRWKLVRISLVCHCVKSVQIRSYLWSLFSCIWTEYGDLVFVTNDQASFHLRRKENLVKLQNIS